MSTATAERVVAAAQTWIGTPYRHQAARKGVGCDCLGLVRGVWREIYGREPELPPELMTSGMNCYNSRTRPISPS